MSEDYSEIFRDAYALLHGGRPDETDSGPERRAGEPVEEYLSRTRTAALGAIRNRLLGAEPPKALAEPHSILLSLLARASAAEEALAEQVRAYQCGQFQESVAHSNRLQTLVTESQRLDRDLIRALRAAEDESAGTLAGLGLDL